MQTHGVHIPDGKNTHFMHVFFKKLWFSVLEFLRLLKLTWTLPHLCVSVVRHQSCVEHSQVSILSFVTDQKLDDSKAWEIGFSFSTLIRLQYKNVFPVIIAICTGLLFFGHTHMISFYQNLAEISGELEHIRECFVRPPFSAAYLLMEARPLTLMYTFSSSLFYCQHR